MKRADIAAAATHHLAHELHYQLATGERGQADIAAELHRRLAVPPCTQITRQFPYVCAECRQPIIGEDPHTRGDGEDVHPACCSSCRGGQS